MRPAAQVHEAVLSGHDLGRHADRRTSSTKNAEGERDPEMKRAKKGNQWYFGIKAHIDVDADSGLVVGTAASVNDVTQAGALLHGEEEAAFRGCQLPGCAQAA